MSSVRRVEGSTQHAPDCECPRCVGFTPGPDGTAVEHNRYTANGAYALVQI